MSFCRTTGSPSKLNNGHPRVAVKIHRLKKLKRQRVLDGRLPTYSRKVGSDHETETIARLTPGVSFDVEAIEDWFEMVEELLLDPESTLTASRD
jgi:hypothetical protein